MPERRRRGQGRRAAGGGSANRAAAALPSGQERAAVPRKTPLLRRPAGRAMFWPGMGDPAKRKQTIKFLIITAAIGISVAAASTLIAGTAATV